MSITDLAGQADACHRLAEVIHAHPDLPAVDLRVGADAALDLQAFAPTGTAEWKVDAWAAALGVTAHLEGASFYQADAMLGGHHVTVWAAHRAGAR